MPTAAKLVALILMAIGGVIVVMLTINTYPDAARRSVGMTGAAVIIGLFVGWRGLGQKSRKMKEQVSRPVSRLVSLCLCGSFFFMLSPI